MCVLLDIININDKLSNYFDCNIYDMFLNNYCLEYYYILKKMYPEGRLVAEKNKDHCAILIDDVIYDVSGIRDKDEFYIADDRDTSFIEEFYNKFNENDRNKLMSYMFGKSKKMRRR